MEGGVRNRKRSFRKKMISTGFVGMLLQGSREQA